MTDTSNEVRSMPTECAGSSRCCCVLCFEFASTAYMLGQMLDELNPPPVPEHIVQGLRSMAWKP